MQTTATATTDQNRELLDEVLASALMGQNAVELLKAKTADPQIISALDAQLNEYRGIAQRARDEMNARSYPQESPAFCEAMMKMSIHMNTLANRSADHIAELLIDGSTMGIVEITRARNKYQNVDAQIAGIAQNLIEVEQRNIDGVKPYLS